jgi:hypothetical protein
MNTTGVKTRTAKPASKPLPAFVERGLPGLFHELLKDLEGSWRVQKEIYITSGSREKPARSSKMIARRKWFGVTAKHLLDVTQGTVDGAPYYSLGFRNSAMWIASMSGRRSMA